MAGLLEIDHGAILASRLISFTKNRVQWLLKNFVVVSLRDVGSNSKFDPFNWVVDESSFV